MNKSSLNIADFKWYVSKKGYSIQSYPSVNELDMPASRVCDPNKENKALPLQRNLFDAPIELSDNIDSTPCEVIISNGGGLVTYTPFKENHNKLNRRNVDLSIAREFSNIIDESGDLNYKDLIRFVNKYGGLGVGLKTFNQSGVLYRYETIKQWESWVQDFRSIFEHIDCVGTNNDMLKNSIKHYNNKKQPLKFKAKIRNETKYLEPSNLLTAMWVLVTKEFSGSLHMRKCTSAGCPKWYEYKRGVCHCVDCTASDVEEKSNIRLLLVT